MRILNLFFLLTILLPLSACSTLIGNVRPVEMKSEAYGVADLSKTDPDWVRLSSAAQQDPQGDNNATPQKDTTPTEVSDVAFQSRKTASIISLNSACRETATSQEQNLRRMTDLLFLGMSDITFRGEQPMAIQGILALETTLHGKLNGEEMMLKTVVLRRGACIYDLVYMARPRHFETQLQDFSRFVASLRLK